MKKQSAQTGSLLVTVLVIMMFLVIVVLGLMLLANINLARARERILLLQTQYTAETGADIAISKLNNGNLANYNFTATPTDILVNGGSYAASYNVKVEDGVDANEKIITSVGTVRTPTSAATPKYTRTVRVTAARKSTMAAASIISRNIVQLASSVKKVTGREVFVNEYIKMDKNTNEFAVEKLTVAGRNVGAGSCSVEGGSFSVPDPPFTPPTILNLAYNNCTSPPGNTSNANYTVNHNQTNIEKVQSTSIPWGYTMSSGYLNANNCSDWTTGASPRTIPSTGNAKKTHYPNADASGIDTSCGTGGTLNLGSNTYTITDHTHIRANLCKLAMGCRPTFINNSGSLKFIFVEGTIAFEGVTVPTAGSAPIVFVSYGSDPTAVTDPDVAPLCPIGGSTFLGGVSAQSITAPNAYFIATNGGVCIDKVKLPSLGGISGKNVYIATQSGNPFSLSFDPTFPVNQIPVNLMWRATLYERLK